MSALWAVTCGLIAAVAAVWAYRLRLMATGRGQGYVLNAASYRDLAGAGRVSVILPAKDEEANLEAALATVLAQDYPDLEVIVVDDRSSDATAALADAAAAADERVRAVHVEALPEGWFGKPHAMHVGEAEATGDWLLFVDADCRQAPHSVRAGMGLCEAEGGDMLSLWPLLELKSFWERAVQPVAGSVLVAWFRPQWVNDPGRRTAFANGQYILVRRSVYEAVGGHASVANELVEDIALARRVKAAGHRLLNAVGEDLFTTRMYAGLAAMWRGWTRIYAGAFRRPAAIGATMVMTLVFTLGPWLALAGSAAATAAGVGGLWAPAAMGVSLAAVGLMLGAMRLLFKFSRANPWYLVFYPLAVAVVLGFQATALVRAAGVGSVEWRGTRYRGGRVVGAETAGAAAGGGAAADEAAARAGEEGDTRERG